MHRQRIVADVARGDGHSAAGIPGDCLRAAVASLVDARYDEVPHFALYPLWWWDMMRLWARGRGRDFVCLTPADGSVQDFLDDPADTWSGLFIGSGPSPRGPFRHVVLVDADLALVHDPHPSGAGVTIVDEVFAYTRPYGDDPAGLVLA